MYYLISGWDDKGNQLVEYHFGNTQAEAEQTFLESIGGGEINEILDTISDQDYEEAIRESERKDEITMTNLLKAKHDVPILLIQAGETVSYEVKEDGIYMLGNGARCGKEWVEKHFEYINANENNTMTNKENTTMKRNYNHYNGIKCIETGKVYTTVYDIVRDLQISRAGVYKVLQGRQLEVGGYHFECVADTEPKEVVIQHKAIIRGKGKSCNGNTNAVLCISTGDVLTSCRDAANHAGVTSGFMSNVCRGNSESAKGKKYCYVKDIDEHLDEVAESIRKAVMYDEHMTKEEKRKELVNRIEYYDNMLEYNEQTINRLLQEKQELQESREKAIKELMNFGF